MQITRRGFLKLGGAVLVAGGLGYLGKMAYDKLNPSDKDLLEYAFNTLNGLRKADDSKSDIYLGNVNDFDNRPTKSYGTEIPAAFDAGYSKEVVLPKYVANAIKNKKDEIRVLYLDSSLGSPYRRKLDDIADIIKNGVKDIFPKLNLRVSTEVLPWKKKMVWKKGGVSVYDLGETFKEGEYLEMANDKKYLLLVEDTDLVAHGLAGGAKIFLNSAEVGVPKNYGESKGYNEPFFYRTLLHEVGHMYGLPHCWEPECAMSYDFLVRDDFVPVPKFNNRCKMIGNNILNGEIVIEGKASKLGVEVGGIEIMVYRAFVKSAKAVRYDVAKSDLESAVLHNSCSSLSWPCFYASP